MYGNMRRNVFLYASVESLHASVESLHASVESLHASVKSLHANIWEGKENVLMAFVLLRWLSTSVFCFVSHCHFLRHIVFESCKLISSLRWNVLSPYSGYVNIQLELIEPP